MPAPTCKSSDFKLTSLNSVVANTAYLGDASKGNWVSSGKPVAYNDNSLLLTMAPDTVGTLLSSTNYVWYGKISATMTTSQGKGVVTAFIMMSDVKDEIDFEFVGTDVSHAQSNYYFQGVTDCKSGEPASRAQEMTDGVADTRSVKLDASNTAQNTHTYTIDWKPDTITWSVDGKAMRTINRKDTFNSTTNKYNYPQTPSRVMLSLWPGGSPSNGQGTIDWAGGLIDWSSPYMQNGYYYAMVTDVTVQCYDPPSGADKKGDKAYVYTDGAGTEDKVSITDNDTVLSSFDATGEHPGKGGGASASPDSTKTASASSSTASNAPESVPGVSGAGERGTDSGSSSGSSKGGSSGAGGGGSSGNSGSGGGSGGGGGGGDSSGFSQGGSSTGSGSNKNAGVRDRSVDGSVFAVLVAVLGLLVL